MNASVDDAIKILNEVIAVSPGVMDALVNHRVPCTEELGDHPTVQVGHVNDDPSAPLEVGLLGIINGIFGARESDGYGYIAASMQDGKISHFERTPQREELDNA